MMGEHFSQTGQTPSHAVVDRGDKVRSEPRVELAWEGPTLRSAFASPAKVIVHDLSAHGFRAEWPYKLQRGDRVWLKMPGFEALPALVAWCIDFRIGCKFEHALHPAVFDKIVQSVTSAN